MGTKMAEPMPSVYLDTQARGRRAVLVGVVRKSAYFNRKNSASEEFGRYEHNGDAE